MHDKAIQQLRMPRLLTLQLLYGFPFPSSQQLLSLTPFSHHRNTVDRIVVRATNTSHPLNCEFAIDVFFLPLSLSLSLSIYLSIYLSILYLYNLLYLSQKGGNFRIRKDYKG